jgi:hypothetical protein
MSIDLYLTQLIEDMRATSLQASGKNKSETIPESSEEKFSEHIKDVENYLYGEQEPLSNIVGIETVRLPPPDILSEKQQAELYDEMEYLMVAFNFYPDFPDKLPAAVKYQIMRDNWDMELVYINSGQSHLEFCHYEPKECPFPTQYCMCRDAF